jgi:hypothetical protein
MALIWVVSGHDHDYERSYPVRGANDKAGTDATTGAVVDTLQPRPIIPANPAATRFDTTQGTVFLILGGGGTSAPPGRLRRRQRGREGAGQGVH